MFNSALIVSAHLDVAFSRQDFSHGNRLNKLHKAWNINRIIFLLRLEDATGSCP